MPIDLFTLDTGLLFDETYALWRQLEQRYGITIRAVRPEQSVNEQALTWLRVAALGLPFVCVALAGQGWLRGPEHRAGRPGSVSAKIHGLDASIVRRQMSVTIRDIAAAAGLSSGTISRALKNGSRVTMETVERVRGASVEQLRLKQWS